MRPRHRRGGEAAVILAGGILLTVLAGVAWTMFILVQVLVLVLTVAAVAVAYRAGQHRGPPLRLVQARPADDAELAGLRAENARLRTQVAQLRREAQEATTAMHAAWGAASSVPPRPRSEHGTAREQLLADPRAGARPIGGPR